MHCVCCYYAVLFLSFFYQARTRGRLKGSQHSVCATGSRETLHQKYRTTTILVWTVQLLKEIKARNPSAQSQHTERAETSLEGTKPSRVKKVALSSLCTTVQYNSAKRKASTRLVNSKILKILMLKLKNANWVKNSFSLLHKLAILI